MVTSLIGAKLPSIVDLNGGPPHILRGHSGLAVELLQEWLTLRGYGTAVDGDFGYGTQASLDAWHRDTVWDPKSSGEPPKGVVVTEELWELLWSPMITALSKDLAPAVVDSVGFLAMQFALGHLQAGAHEIGHNQGPWVRLYTSRDPVRGNDGRDFAWCGAFVRFCIHQAIELLGKGDNHVWGYVAGWNVDRVAEWGMANDLFKQGPYAGNAMPDIKPGDVFLVRRTDYDWVHIGFVEDVNRQEQVISTVEGNTNVAGSREGTSVMRRFRSCKGLDFVCNFG